MIWFFTPYAHDKKLLDAIDRCFNLVPNSNDWVVLMDGDTAFLRSDSGHVTIYLSLPLNRVVYLLCQPVPLPEPGAGRNKYGF